MWTSIAAKMIGVDLVPLISTGIGAAIALGGTVLADLMRSRDTRERDRITDRRDVYLQLTLAHGLALQELRDVAGRSFGSEADRLAAVAAAMTVSGIYPARDRLLMAAPRWVLRSAEIAFDRLIRLRTSSAPALRSAASITTRPITRTARRCGRCATRSGRISAPPG